MFVIHRLKRDNDLSRKMPKMIKNDKNIPRSNSKQVKISPAPYFLKIEHVIVVLDYSSCFKYCCEILFQYHI